jgi:uncharacterized protein (TIRG00374 family)
MVVAGTFFFGTLRWQILLKAQDFSFSITELLRLTLIGIFFNNFLLGTNGGDIIKAYYIGKEAKKNKAAAILTIFVDRIVGFLSFLVLATVMIFLNFNNPQLRNLLRFLGICYSIIFLGLIVALNIRKTKKLFSFIERFSKVKNILGELYQALDMYRSRKKHLATAFLMSLSAQFFLVYAIFLLSNSLSIKAITFFNYLTLVPVIQTISSVPVSFSGLGITEGAYVYFLTPLGISMEKSFALSFLARVFNIFWGLTGAGVYLMSDIRLSSAKKS